MDKIVTIGLIGVGGYLLYHFTTSVAPLDLLHPEPINTSIAPSSVVAATNPIALQIGTLMMSGVLSPGQLVSYAYNHGIPSVIGGPMLNVGQWNYLLTNMLGIPGQALGDDGSPVNAGKYVSLLSNWARANGSTV